MTNKLFKTLMLKTVYIGGWTLSFIIKHMGVIVKSSRKILVALVGFPLLIIGIILIPLPGPGVLVCMAAFFILSLEFEWARRYFEKAKQELKNIYEKSKPKE